MGRSINKILGITKAKRKVNKTLRGGMKKRNYDFLTQGKGCQLMLILFILPTFFILLIILL